MKRFYKLLGIAALIAAIATGLAGCPDDGGGGGGGSISLYDLVGTWKNDSNSKTIQFGMVAKIYGVECISLGGPAIGDGSPASTTPPSGYWLGMVDNYLGAIGDGFKVAFEGGKLRVSESSGDLAGLNGLYTKQ
jgi:hypothetical protein